MQSSEVILYMSGYAAYQALVTSAERKSLPDWNWEWDGGVKHLG
jgi:hypothetical protein